MADCMWLGGMYIGKLSPHGKTRDHEISTDPNDVLVVFFKTFFTFKYYMHFTVRNFDRDFSNVVQTLLSSIPFFKSVGFRGPRIYFIRFPFSLYNNYA